jgi:type IV secretory pathway VirD2 relaxase
MRMTKQTREASTLRIKRSRSGSSSSKSGFQRQYQQRAIVKTYYASPKQLGSHLKYIQRDGAGVNGKKPELFTASDKHHSLEDVQNPEPGRNEERFFKVILSPENGEQIQKTGYGMENYTKDFMKALENETGKTYRWAATVHDNTDNPHAHIVIRGLDREGTEVNFSREMVSSRMRGMAQEIATKELGPRTAQEVQQQKFRETSQDRFTSIDRQIKLHSDPVLDKESNTKGYRVIATNNYENERLKNLSSVGLASKHGKEYELSKNWENTLKSHAKQQDILKTVYDKNNVQPHDKFLVYRNKWNVSGTVEKVGQANESNDRPYVLVRNRTGKLYYHSSDDLHGIKPGDKVKIENGKTTDLSRNIDRNNIPYTRGNTDWIGR